LKNDLKRLTASATEKAKLSKTKLQRFNNSEGTKTTTAESGSPIKHRLQQDQQLKKYRKILNYCFLQYYKGMKSI